jgi:hypothetical protein
LVSVETASVTRSKIGARACDAVHESGPGAVGGNRRSGQGLVPDGDLEPLVVVERDQEAADVKADELDPASGAGC